MKHSEAEFPWMFFFLFFLGFAVWMPFMSVPEQMIGEASRMPASEDLSCNCRINGEVFKTLTYETPEECGAERTYLEKSLQSFHAADPQDLFSEARPKSEKQFPKKCFLFAMKHTFPTSFKEKRFGRCGDMGDAVAGPDYIRTSYKPCVSEDLVNVIYHSYLDAADCFDIPLKFSLPKFMNESGVMPNTIAFNSDAGLSQFSNEALEILKKEYPDWSKKLQQSKKKSCQNLLSIAGAFPKKAAEIVSDAKKKCHVVEIPPNPARNFIYYGVYHNIMKRDVEKFWGKRRVDQLTGVVDPAYKTIETLMKELKIEDFDANNLRRTFAVMAYNKGPKVVSYFREWLLYRQSKFPEVPIRRADLKMTLPQNPWSINDVSVDDLRVQYEVDGTRAVTFAEWLVLNVKNKFRYASFVKFYADQLDRNLGKRTCTEEKFLEL